MGSTKPALGAQALLRGLERSLFCPGLGFLSLYWGVIEETNSCCM